MFPLIPQKTFVNPRHVLEQAGLALGMRVADFGCGAGDFVLLASKMVGSEGAVTAIDVQESALSSVSSRARIESALNISVFRANLEVVRASGLTDLSQDAVLLTNILFQTEKKKEIASEAYRVLRSGGILVFMDWKKDSALGPTRLLRLDARDIRRVLEEQGFAYQKEIDAGAYHFGMLFVKQLH